MAGKYKPYKPQPEPKKEEPVAEVVEEVKEEDIFVDAVIEGAGHLNIRSTPEQKEGNIIGIFPDGTDCKVNKSHEAKDWYKIIVGDPVVKGYAMKKYITIK